ncbi:hypothetical protein ABPG72_006494 [Tetrahymena utriculariae]
MRFKKIFNLIKTSRINPEQKNSWTCKKTAGFEQTKSYKYSSIKSTYSNKCTACAEKYVEFYAEGSCEAYPKIASFCHPSAYLNQACTQESYPVCGLFDSSVLCKKAPCGSNFSNKCVACTNEQVSYFLLGQFH